MTNSSNYTTENENSQDKYRITIGIECHVQLATKTKLAKSITTLGVRSQILAFRQLIMLCRECCHA